ncbi:hypothetical protein CYMTET_42269 [Cymbomonas tetramitiformis]|uniref:Uncharacterized protein n=1 Tax=Cymbomonas tetramitiformis TaxID=36881 RepID=A0AAE0F1E4_9CHLO|nr:hypothetical protein CYMTET_42269 [Cymbomonas tetramitiformis]
MLGGKEERFHGDESNAFTLFARLVPAIQKAFTAEDVAFATLFTLDDATATTCSGCAKDPHGAIADFNDALKSARRRATMDDEDAKGGPVHRRHRQRDCTTSPSSHVYFFMSND